MKVFICATTMAVLAALPAAAQSSSETPSDRYTRDPAQAREQMGQQAQTRERSHAGEVETLRRKNMSSPNVSGQQVPEDTSTGVPEAQERGNAKKTEGAIRP